MDNKAVGDLLREYRKIAFPDMGLRRVSAEIGMDYAHLFRIEKGQYIPSDETLIKLADRYQLSENQKFELMILARMTPEFEETSRKAYQSNPKSLQNALALYRKKKRN